MKLSQFNCQPLGEKAQLVLLRGKLLLIRQTSACCIFLYDMGGFFAETWYSVENKRVIFVQGFKNTAILSPYLDLIDITKLVEKE